MFYAFIISCVISSPEHKLNQHLLWWLVMQKQMCGSKNTMRTKCISVISMELLQCWCGNSHTCWTAAFEHIPLYWSNAENKWRICLLLCHFKVCLCFVSNNSMRMVNTYWFFLPAPHGVNLLCQKTFINTHTGHWVLMTHFSSHEAEYGSVPFAIKQIEANQDEDQCQHAACSVRSQLVSLCVFHSSYDGRRGEGMCSTFSNCCCSLSIPSLFGFHIQNVTLIKLRVMILIRAEIMLQTILAWARNNSPTANSTHSLLYFNFLFQMIACMFISKWDNRLLRTNLENIWPWTPVARCGKPHPRFIQTNWK